MTSLEKAEAIFAPEDEVKSDTSEDSGETTEIKMPTE